MERIMVLDGRQAHRQQRRSRAGGGHCGPFGPKMVFNYPERAGVLPYRDTESQLRRVDLTNASPSGPPAERRRLAAYPAVPNASAAIITVSATNAPVFPASAPRRAAR